MPKASEIRSEYIVQFVAPYKDPRLVGVQLEDHLYMVTMTSEQAEQTSNTLQRMFSDGFIVQSFSVTLAELVRVTPGDLNRRMKYFKQQGMA